MFPTGLLLATSVAVLASVGVHVGRRAHRAALVRRAAAAWAQTTGSVLSTTIQIRRLGQGRSEVPMVIYAYQVDGRPYQSYRVRAGDDTGGLKVSGEASRTLERYPVGSNVTVYYDPADPTKAALER
ncbi:MAG: hypothetical protein JWN99_757 [Ilumatobacteraceae bacterium]|nr:hypothetical protein [Ilumatobacteraceae bacterium]